MAPAPLPRPQPPSSLAQSQLPVRPPCQWRPQVCACVTHSRALGISRCGRVTERRLCFVSSPCRILESRRRLTTAVAGSLTTSGRAGVQRLRDHVTAGPSHGDDHSAAELVSRLLAPETSPSWPPHLRSSGRYLADSAPVVPLDVTLRVNAVVAACASEAACSATLDPAVTPSITAVTPSTGDAGATVSGVVPERGPGTPAHLPWPF